MLRSQRGPLASIAFTSFPSDRSARFDSAPFRVLLLRRLRLPLPLTVRSCRCGRPLDALGHHRAACATAGVLGRRGWALESAAARVCREGGARVRTNVFVRDMDLAQHDHADGRRLEVVADGPLLFGGSQLATPQWCHLCTQTEVPGEVQPPKMGKPWRRPADAKSARTLSLLEKGAGRVLSCWRQRLEVVGPMKPQISFVNSLGPRCVNSPRTCSATVEERGSGDGRSCWVAQPRSLLLCPSLTLHQVVATAWSPSVHEVICEARHS